MATATVARAAVAAGSGDYRLRKRIRSGKHQIARLLHRMPAERPTPLDPTTDAAHIAAERIIEHLELSRYEAQERDKTLKPHNSPQGRPSLPRGQRRLRMMGGLLGLLQKARRAIAR